MSRFDDTFLDTIKDRVALSEIVGRYVSWDKKSRPAAGDFWACCPSHSERSPSFHVLDKKGFAKCFSCGFSAGHFKFLQEIGGMTFPQAVAEVASLAGMSLPNAAPLTDEQKAEYGRRMRQREQEAAKRQADDERARQRRIGSVRGLWNETLPLKGTPAEEYLRFRHSRLPEFADENLRFHPGLEHPDTGDQLHPALVARVQGPGGAGIAIWRVFVASDGQGKAKLPAGSSAKLGLGPAAGGAVRIGGIAERIGLCEGVESGLAVRALGVSYPVWPALSTSGIQGFKIPDGVKTVICYPDPDGEKLRTRERRDGTEFISHPPGRVAVAKFIENNPGRDIRVADAAANDDFLELLQKSTGEPVR